jgi:outer membrane protein assembly factor BamA
MKCNTIITSMLLVCSTALFAEETHEQKSWGVVPLPIIAYSPDYGGMFGAAAIFYYSPDVGLPEEERAGLRNNTVAANGISTTNGSYIGAIAMTNYLRAERYRWDNSLAGNQIPRPFFGIGPEADAEEEYTARSFGAQTNFNVQAAEDLFVGPLYQYEYFSIRERDSGGLLDTGDLRGAGQELIASGLGGRLIWDTTGGTFWPTHGFVLDTDVRYYPESLGSSYSFGLYGADLRRYFSLFGTHVLALQGRYRASWGDVPFQFLPSVGGDGPMRGVLEQRYRDAVAATVQAEYRVPLNRRFGMVGFVSAGQVGDDPGDLKLSNPKIAGGFGFRVALSTEQKLNLRIDIAFSQMGTSPYINMREAF